MLLLAVSTLVGCKLFSVSKRPQAVDHFTSKNNVIHYDDKPFAKLQAITYSLDGGEMVREMNFKLLKEVNQELVEALIMYLHEKNQDEEIEVEFDVDGEFNSINL